MAHWIKFWLVTMMMLASNNAANAADIESLLMPGPVIEGHAKLETECSRCHVRFSKRTQNQLCRDCHEDIDKDIRHHTGFHGRNPAISDATCKSCHTEHVGRDADIVHLNRATFDHDLTDFHLRGGHASVACASCHEEDRKFSETPGSCIDCHRDNDPHKGNLGDKCGDCHTPRAWNEFEFDHDKTDFPLEGKHKKAACDACHVNERYKNTPATCDACHALDDVHGGDNGDKCEDCHSPRDWKKSEFDHDRDTEFRLRGRHRKIECEACHVEPVNRKEPPSDCHGCHRNDDQHRGRYGRKCDSCHNEKSWKRARFDHTGQTDFPLKGKHRDLNCDACHQGKLDEEQLGRDCIACHRADDAHDGRQGEDCARCHTESGWAQRVLFDHDLTPFPLIGMHASAPCEECHLSTAYGETRAECNACHEQDDVHKGGVGTDCGRCHNPNDWALWMFDHDKQTDFSIDGAHSDLLCADCHNKPVGGRKVDQSVRCNACHAQDDAHGGRFGRYCERCHNTDSFRDVSIQR